MTHYLRIEKNKKSCALTRPCDFFTLSAQLPADVGLFPGFLHMMREPDAKRYFPPHVKLIRMSQSDFNLPDATPRNYTEPRRWDFTYVGTT